MKILFSPSEGKSDIETDTKLDISLFPDLSRLEAISKYDEFNKDCKNLKEFGEDRTPILNRKTCKAIERYNGVAFEYLDYSSIKNKSYLDDNLIIFSNLFGPILAKDKIPNYKFKQGAKIPNFDIQKFYKDNFSDALNQYLDGEEVLDLRAKFYEKQYKNRDVYRVKFLKNGKVVSHWAKAYRGLLVRFIAENDLYSIDDIIEFKFDNMKFLGIEGKELIFEILL